MNANLLYLTNIVRFLLDEAETNKRKREPTESDNAKRQCGEKKATSPLCHPLAINRRPATTAKMNAVGLSLLSIHLFIVVINI